LHRVALSTIEKYKELRNKTVLGLFQERAEKTPSEVAFRVKKYGIYLERTWVDFRRMVAACAVAFEKMGLCRGERVALMGDPCEEYIVCELAAQSLGAVTYGIYPTSSQKELRFLMEDGEAVLFVAENQEYVDRILPLMEELERLRHVLVIDTRGIFMYDHPSLAAYEDHMEKGEKSLASGLISFEEKVRQITPSDPLFIVYTSGTTGNPKGVLISHGRHLAGVYTLIDRYPILAEEAHRTIVYLPLCHVLGKDVAVTLPLLTRIVPHYGESIEDLGQTIFETAPTVLFTVPRYLQKFLSSILVGIENTSFLKRSLYKLAMKTGRLYIKQLWDGRKNPLLAILYFLAHHTVFRPILNKAGFDRLKICLSAGAPLPPEVMALWQIYGVNLSEFYGQTETGGAIISAQGDHFPRPGDVGVPPSGWKVDISDNGEIRVHGEDIFEGYLNHPEMTREVVEDGWLRSGDVGEWTAEGRLKIIDRARDIIVTSGGKTLSPTYIENNLRSSPYISEAVVFGHKRKYISALIEIDFETVADWARTNNISYMGFTSLVQNPAVIRLIGDEIEKANQDIARVEQVKKFRIIPKLLDPSVDGEPVTPTRKVKRELMYQQFKEIVESMYSDKEEKLVAMEIRDVLAR